MNNRRKAFLQIPQGTEGLYLEEAFRHRELIRHLENLFSGWGYLPVQTPVFDFFDTYRPLLDSGTVDKIYRLIDREGDLLMLRSDVTLFLAKQMGLALRPEDIPVRVFYSDVILRHQHSEDISRNEFFQVGAELIGKSGERADLEIIMLLIRSLELMELAGVTLHIGSRELFQAGFDRYSEQDRRAAITAITARDFSSLERLMTAQGEPPDRVRIVSSLYSFIGTPESFTGFLAECVKTGLLTQPEHRQLEYLESIVRGLVSVNAAGNLRIDLSEVGTQPYYSGIVFQAYMPETDAAIASGGRYDGLLGFFGFEAPSVGFSILLRKLEGRLGRPERFMPPVSRTVVENGSFAEVYRKAEELRAQGKAVVL